MVSRIVASSIVVGMIAFNASSEEKPKNTPHSLRKQAILLVAFGTSHPDAIKALDNVLEKTKKRFPGIPVRWAYTSSFIRKKLAKKGQMLDSPTLALAKLLDEGFTQVAVQSLHTIPGIEFDDLKAEVEKFTQGPASFKNIELGSALLSNYENMRRAVEGMLAAVPSERQKNEAIIFMGHGSEHHYADLMYVAFQQVLSRHDSLAFIGTVEGHPTLDDVISECRKVSVGKAWLIPFMSVAGDHAKNDMAGEEPDSWASQLKKAGITPAPVLKGTADNDKIVDIWLDNLSAAMKKMDE